MQMQQMERVSAPVSWNRDPDEEAYFTSRSQELEQAGELDQARACILVAQTVYPRSFVIKFEAYRLDRDALCIKESAAHLQRLCRQFPDEPALWAEMRGVADALRSEEADSQSRFLRQVFCHLSTELQHRALSVIADRSSDTLEHCQLVLLLLNRFPHMVNGHGTRVVDLLLTAERHAPFKSPLNKYRKFLVCDLLPSLLNSKASELTYKQLVRLFLRSVEFYVCYVTSDSNKIEGTGDEESVELKLADPWQDMCTVCQLCATKLRWQLADVFTHKRSRDLVWQQLHSFYREHATSLEDSGVQKQLLYCTAAVMLQSLVDYTQRIDPTFAPGTAATPSSALPPALMLVQAFVEPLPPGATPPPAPGRRRRSEDDLTGPLLTVSKQVSIRPQQLTLSFLTALRCWRLLEQNPLLEKELARVWQYLNADSWPWFQSFVTDVQLYSGSLQQLVARTAHPFGAAGQPAAAAGGAHLCRQLLQRAAAAYGTADYHLSGELCLVVLTGPLLPATLGDPAKAQVVAKCAQPRHLHFLSYTQADVSKYCIKMLSLCLQQKVFSSSTFSNGAVGHLMVLLQHDWPTEEPVFSKVVQRIRQRGTFSYPHFVQYVTCADMVEEFVYLSTEHGGGLSFSLLPAQQPRQRTMSTRGVDKGVKEEFRQAMLVQIQRPEPVLSIVGEFLTAEKDDILRCLR